MSEDDPHRHKWFHDHLTPDLVLLHSIREVTYSGRSPFQSIDIIDTNSFGACLVLDGKIQSSEHDEFIYHEALVHPVMLSHSAPEKVLIAGGGEGATLREVLAHRSVKKVTMVDLDREVVDICRRFLPSLHQNSFDDPRLELHFADARGFLERNKEGFDVILLDLPDPIAGGPARLLYTREFYRLVRQRLDPGGIMSVQAEPASWHDLQEFAAIANTLRSVFPVVRAYRTHIPSFASMWGFITASARLDPAALAPDEIDHRVATRLSREPRSYDGHTHLAMFSIPKHIRQRMAATERVSTDQDPISAY